MYTEAVQNAAGPLLVEIDRPFCCSLGVELVAGSYRGHGVICIGSILPASIADRSMFLCSFLFSLWCNFEREADVILRRLH